MARRCARHVASCRTATVALLLALAAASPAVAEDDWYPSRRKDPFPSERSYLIFPLPYSIPGIGSGLFLTLYETNYVFPHRAYFLLVAGDAEGTIFGVEQIQLLPKRLLLDLFTEDLNKASIRNYTLRGMDTGKNDYNLIELNKVDYSQWQLTYTAWERRFDAFVNGAQQGLRTTRVRDSSGNVISNFAEAQNSYQQFYVAGFQLDLTDEFYDPRRGARLVTQYQDAPRQSSAQPDYYTVNVRFNGYIPVGRQSTLAFTVLQSDARVRSKGDTDVASLTAKNFLGCTSGDPRDPVCQAQSALVANDLAANSNGSSTPLGGSTYLRAYSDSRFRGAHTLFSAVEFRLNLTDEFTPFDYLIFKDVRTSLQIAPFYEAGSVSETEGSLGATWKTDYGIGLRMVTGSGTAYRVDVAVGDEGSATTIFVNYPW